MRKKITVIAVLSTIILLLLGANYICFLSPNALFGRQQEIIQETIVENVQQESTSEENAKSTPPVVNFDELSGKEPIEETPEESEVKEYDLQLMAVGDNLIHMGIIYSGLQADGTYQYDFMFDGIRDFLAISDIKIINQETPLAGNELGFSGYPTFNSPTEIGDAIAKAGFNIVLGASNHSADQKISGIDSMVSYWKKHPEVLLVGIHEPLEDGNADIATDSDFTNQPEDDNRTDSILLSHDKQNPRIGLISYKDIRISVINVTYGPNYESLPKALEERMDTLCAHDSESRRINYTTINQRLLDDIAYAKTISDFVIVCPHWGSEYTLTPTKYQVSFATQMTQAGADLIIGTHPHVPEPVEWITSENGNKSLCYYSLGNYVSTQKNTDTMLEGMAWVALHVTEDGVSINEEKTGVIPMVCHYSASPVRLKKVYMLEDYTEELAACHGIQAEVSNFTLEYLQSTSQKVFGDWALSPKEILNKHE